MDRPAPRCSFGEENGERAEEDDEGTGDEAGVDENFASLDKIII